MVRYYKPNQIPNFEPDENPRRKYSLDRRNIPEVLLSLQKTAGNMLTGKILGNENISLQRMHHTKEAREGDHREGAVEELSHYPKGTIGYSLWGVYKNFHHMPVYAVGDGSGLRTTIRENKEFLEKPIAKKSEERRRDAEEWADKESRTFASSSDLQTRTAGAVLSPQTRAMLFNTWQTAGTYVPDWMKSNSK